MIRYALRCPQDHRFDSWFRSAGGYEELVSSGRITCPECGSDRIEKAPMAPRLGAARPTELPLARLRRKVETEADYVGAGFASEARSIHAGMSANRPIWGEARPGEALDLLRDGIPVLPLPFAPRSKTN